MCWCSAILTHCNCIPNVFTDLKRSTRHNLRVEGISPILYDRHVLLITDHKPLVYINTDMLTLMFMLPNKYDYSIVYMNTRHHSNANTLSGQKSWPGSLVCRIRWTLTSSTPCAPPSTTLNYNPSQGGTNLKINKGLFFSEPNDMYVMGGQKTWKKQKYKN